MEPSLTLSSCVRPVANVLVRELNGETIILNLNTGLYLGLDAIGSDFYQHLIAHESLAEAHQALLRQYDIQSETLEKDLLDFTQKLLDQQLVELVSESSLS